MSHASDKIDKDIMKLHIRSDGKLSLAESYMLPFNLRQKYIKAYNEYIDEKNSNNSA